MSIEAMTMVTLTGPDEMVDVAIRRLLVNREVHPENTIKAMATLKKLLPFDSSNPYSEPLTKVYELARSLKIKLGEVAFSREEPVLDELNSYLSDLSEQAQKASAEWEQLNNVVRDNGVVDEQLSHYLSFDVELKSLFEMKYVKFRFGRMPADSYKDNEAKINARPDTFYIVSGAADRWVYGAYFALISDALQVDSFFDSRGFERIHIDIDGNVESTVAHVEERIARDTAAAKERLAQLAKEREALVSHNKNRIIQTYCMLKYMNEAFSLRSVAGHRHGKFYIIGWIPTKLSNAYATECEGIEGFACTLSAPSKKKNIRPPIKLKKGFLSGIYEPFVEMYGFPAYGEMDPRLFMAVTYTLLFGIMFGDVGQGVCLVVVGLLLWKLKKMWLGRIVALCGVSAACFGFAYGSVFGSEELISGFHVLEDGNTMKILIIAVAIGVVLILASMIMNIINGIRQKDIKKIYFSPNGLAGFVLYAGIALGAVLQILKGISVFTPLYIIFVIALPLILIFAAGPITKLLTGQKDWKPESVGMFFVEGFFELFETILSYVSNTVSFLRVGAFAISHAGMMMVVFLLSSSGEGYSIPGLIFGNLLVTGLETVLVCIQVMRLEFYEMFGRFYESGGVKFSPKTINYNTAD